MGTSYWFYLKNIFINPVKASKKILSEQNLNRLFFLSFLIAALSYIIIVLMGYNILGWNEFPYKKYYPYYFNPYWWEVFVVPLWGLVIAFGFGIPCYFFGKLFNGSGSFRQVISFIMLASIVSLPVFIIVDVLTLLYDPEWIIRFAKFGNNFVPYDQYPNKIIWIIETVYSFIAMTWQAVVTIVGLTVIHKLKWYKNLPGIIVGNIIFIIFLILIKDYVALII